MADTKISAMSHATVDPANDLVVVVDVSDNTQGSGGSTKYAKVSELQPTTGLEIDQWTTSFGTATDGATVTFDLSTHSRWQVTLGGDRMLALSNPSVGSTFTLFIKQDATGGRTVTWFSGILWGGDGSPPTLSTGAGKEDEFTFVCRSSGVYNGHVAGQNFG